MEIQDSLPERRNLVIISLAFIIYFYAGGQFTGEEVKLIMINAKFTKPWVLELIVWLGFVYCIWRYWLVTKGKFSHNFRVDLNDFRYSSIILRHIESRCPVRINNKASYNYSIQNINFKRWLLSADILYNRQYKNTDLVKVPAPYTKIEYYLRKHGGPQNYKVHFTDIAGVSLSVYIFLRVALTRPSSTLFLMPYLLATIAIGGAITS